MFRHENANKSLSLSAEAWVIYHCHTQASKHPPAEASTTPSLTWSDGSPQPDSTSMEATLKQLVHVSKCQTPKEMEFHVMNLTKNLDSEPNGSGNA